MDGRKAIITLRMDADKKADAEALLYELGLDIPTAFNLFIDETLKQGQLPFDTALETPQRESFAAQMRAARGEG